MDKTQNGADCLTLQVKDKVGIALQVVQRLIAIPLDVLALAVHALLLVMSTVVALVEQLDVRLAETKKIVARVRQLHLLPQPQLLRPFLLALLAVTRQLVAPLAVIKMLTGAVQLAVPVATGFVLDVILA